MTGHRRARVPRGAPLDPRVPPRAGRRARCSTRSSRPRASRRRRTTRARGGSSSSTAPTRRRRSPPAWARAGAPISRATASHPTRVDELVDASHAKLTGAPALVLGCLTWDGLDRYPDDRPPARRVGHGAAVARRRGREPHARRRRPRPRVVLGRGADLLPRSSTRRARAPRRVAPPRARAGRPPRPGLRRPRRARPSPSTTSAPSAEPSTGVSRERDQRRGR